MKTRSLYNKKSTNPADKLCRRCHESLETAFHILQTCKHVVNARIRRHNYIANKVGHLVNKLIPNSKLEFERLRVNLEGARQRPDVVITSPTRVLILEIAVTWDATVQALDYMYKEKFKKYSNLKAKYAAQGLEVCLIPVVVGARGLLSKDTKKALRAVGAQEYQLSYLAADAVVGSLCVYNKFMAL